MKLTKLLMAAGMALTLAASAQDVEKPKGERRGGDRGDKHRGDRRGGDRRGGDRRGGGLDWGMMRNQDPAEAQKRLEEIRKKADADGDGELTGDERRAFYTAMRDAWTKQREEFLKKWDKDGDGQLSEDERKAVRDGQLDDEFTRMDTNKDGVVDKKEFLASKEQERKGWDAMRNTFRGMRGGDRGGRDEGEDGKAMIERFDENGDGTVDDNERLKAAQQTLERMERRGLQGEWKKFDKDANGTLSQEEKDALVVEIANRLKKRIAEGGAPKTKKRGPMKDGVEGKPDAKPEVAPR